MAGLLDERPFIIEFNPEDHIFAGHIIGIRDAVGFHGESVAEPESAFKEAVDNYPAACEKLGQQPNKQYSGNLMLRVPAEFFLKIKFVKAFDNLHKICIFC